MAVASIEFAEDGTSGAELTSLPFPPLTVSHVLNCSYHSWYSRYITLRLGLDDTGADGYRYRSLTPKARLVALTRPFIEYLRSDGIVLPSDNDQNTQDWSDTDSGVFSSTENPNEANDEEDVDPSATWPEVHESIKVTIAELGGKVVPKLNWSAPKDATWISATNSMECRSANDIYLLLKSSDFITHDLEHAFDDCTDEDGNALSKDQEVAALNEIAWHLVLRKYVQLNPSVEFRVFVRQRSIIGICQRDLNHFEFLFNLQGTLQLRIESFFEEKLKNTFPDENFAFDVYIPPPHDRVWLIDINPWAIRTDPLLFSWKELLTMPGPEAYSKEEPFARFYFNKDAQQLGTDDTTKEELGPVDPTNEVGDIEEQLNGVRFTDANDGYEHLSSDDGESTEREDDYDDVEADIFVPEFRLIKRDDPEAYGFTTPQYSAHKLPRDVVDASRGGESSLREFANQWKEVLAQRQREDEEAEQSEGD